MTSNAVDWDLDKFDDGTFKIVGEVELRKYGNFLDEFADELQNLQDALTGDNTLQSWDMTSDVISLYYFPTEQTSLVNLINTDNKVLNKVLLVLVSLCSEMSQLAQEARNTFYPALLFYGEGDLTGNIGEAEAQIYMGQFIPVLQNLTCFVSRVQQVTKNLVNQLAALHTRGPQRVMDLTNVHFQLVFEHLGELLGTLITLDYIINNQNNLQDHWTLYKRMIKAVRPNCTKFNVAPDKLKQFQKLLGNVESQIINANMFQNCIRQEFDEGQSLVSKNVGLSDEFIQNITTYLWQVDAKLGEPTELDHRNRLVGISALYVLHFSIFRSADKKIFKQLWDTYKKVPSITLTGNVIFFIDKFLLEHLPQMMKFLDKKAQSTVIVQQLNFLQNKAQTLTKDAQTYYLQVALWLMKVESGFTVQGDVMEYLNKRSSLLIQGLMVAYNISHTVRTVMNLQVAHNKPMTKTTVIALCKMIELLKAIQNTYHHYSLNIADSINHLVQHLCSVALNNIAMVKKRLVSNKKYNERHLDVISALMLVEQAINGPGTKERRLVTHLALAVGIQMQSFQEDELSHLSLVLRKLDHVCNLWEKMQIACDCSFLYWHRVVLPVYLADVYSSGIDCHRIHYMFAALRDCAVAGSRSAFPNLVTKSFDEEIFKCMKDNILDPLCQAVETDLRLHIHSHLQLDSRNPFQIGINDLTPVLAIKPVRFPGRYINIKAYVESYLDKTFYNLTTVALHDWKTYAEMRRLAEQKYGLYTVEAHLPSQTLEQGLDVLEIMRNINVFVSKYLYNLNNQIFVEKSSNNKHLNAINIRHIANSIRTHGIGVINTTVNFTYQFLRKKFYIFSQFMYDEHIKSRLIKDIRFFKENKGSTAKKYPFERADKFNRGIRKLGVMEDGLSYLDQFRQLISHIGNAMGYVRMIRSGGLHCCSNAIRFIPDLEDIVNFEELCKQEALPQDCISAASKLDDVISNLNKNFTEGTEYFKLLVDVFSSVFTNPQNIHLRNFYIILPPLTLNFIEHSITCKENMNRKNKLGAAFTDDGFAMGVAYILKLLDQYEEFDSLQWFQSVREKYRKEKGEVRPSGQHDDEKLQQTMTLTLKRLDMYQQEFDLLYYSLSSARIFFRADRHHYITSTVALKD